jgi:voltage-gated potassium channel
LRISRCGCSSADQPLQEFTRISTWTDIAVIISFLAPFAGEAGGFLRTLRTLRLLRDYQVVAQLRADSPFFRRNEEVVFAVTTLAVFIFVMTGIVYETQSSHNRQIASYADALYFTVTALTTTGFGDIILPGTVRRLITVVIMIFGLILVLESSQGTVGAVQSPIPVPDLRSAAP